MSGWWRGLNPALAVAVGALALLLMGAAVPWFWQAHQRAKAEARLGQGQAGAAMESGRVAVDRIGAAQARENRTRGQDEMNRGRIENANGADEQVGAGVHDAGLDGLCRRAAYRDSERCQLRGAGAE